MVAEMGVGQLFSCIQARSTEMPTGAQLTSFSFIPYQMPVQGGGGCCSIQRGFFPPQIT